MPDCGSGSCAPRPPEYFNEFVRERMFRGDGLAGCTLRKAGVEIWAVSSTNSGLSPRRARFRHSRGAHSCRRGARENGIISSEIVDVPTDEGKAESLKRVRLADPDAVFGNSIHDLAMLEIARNPFPVNPSPGFLEAAAKRGWGILFLSRLMRQRRV